MHIYVGDAEDKKSGGRNLGRFGFIRPGDLILLTPRETLSVVGDKRFEEYDPAKHDKVVPEVDEKAEYAAQLETIRQMNSEQLREKAREMGIQIHHRLAPGKILALVLAKLANPNTPEPDDEEHA